jgi:hypothetical protein
MTALTPWKEQNESLVFIDIRYRREYVYRTAYLSILAT